MALIGALLYFDRGARDGLELFGETMTRLGYAASPQRSDLEVLTVSGKLGSCVRVDGLDASLAFALARRVASGIKKPVRALTVTVVESGKSEEDFDCIVDDQELDVKGARRRGAWADDTTAEYGSDWGQLCDAKPYALVDSLLTMGAAELLGEDVELRFAPHGHLRSPAAIGAPRLDEIAKRVRVAERAQMTVVAGRPCVRVTDTGSTVTSFIDAKDVETLRAALGALLD